jgi:hypothetical protein
MTKHRNSQSRPPRTPLQLKPTPYLPGRSTTARKLNGKFAKGAPKPAKAGRPKGKLNRTTTMLKDAILTAAELCGRDGKGLDGMIGYLQMLATKERALFARLLEKVLPMQFNVVDKTVRRYTAEEAILRLQERGLPVPPGLLQIAEGVSRDATENYADELNGVGTGVYEPPSSDREIN